MKKQLHIARNGQVIGQFDTDKINHFLEMGRLLSTDHYYDDAKSSWVLLSEWKEPGFRPRMVESLTATVQPESKEFELPEKPDEVEEESEAAEKPEKSGSARGSRSRGRGGKSKKKGEPGLVGWIACLFVIGVAAGLWVWSQSLGEQIVILKEEASKARTSEGHLRKVNDALNEVTPTGSVRAIIIYEPMPGQTAIVSGATVGLYPRADVQKTLEQVTTDGSMSFAQKIDRIKSSLPSPMAVTLTDSNGRLNMAVPDKGDYVLVASAAKGGGPEAVQLLWLAGFRAEDRPSLMILLDEKNALSEKNQELRVRNVLGLGLTD